MIILGGTNISSLQSDRLMPPIFGTLAANFGMWLFPLYLVLILVLMVGMNEMGERKT